MSGSRSLRARYRRILGYFARLTAQLWFFDAVLPRLGLRRLAERGREKRLTGISQMRKKPSTWSMR